MQTFAQTFSGAQTWVLNVPGKYFTTLQCTNPINVRFYKGGKQLDLGQISQLLAGLEVTLGNIEDTEAAFDRVEVDVAGADTIQIGIGNGQARYNRSQGSVAITNVNGTFSNTQKTVTNAGGQLLAANALRRYLIIQNNDVIGDIYVRMDGTAATLTTGIKIPAGGTYEIQGFVPTGAITAIGSIASNVNIVTVEG
jgi:hypothetical protein